MNNPEDGRIKLYLTQRLLNFRRTNHDLFATGAYQPLGVAGKYRNHVIAFTRTTPHKSVIVAAGRFFNRLGLPERLPIGPTAWADTAILGDGKPNLRRCRNILTDEWVTVKESNDGYGLPLAEVFSHMPVALIEL
jgi:(1->4)-alpha-D-glucan 1-alpha-D-glucosylmutase